MAFTTLISTDELALHPHDPSWLVVDCRFNLADTSEGRREYEAMHIEGAVFLDLDHDLSASVVPGVTGRHPLPTPGVAAATFARVGIGADTQVIAYDDRGGMTAGRLWWMLRWLGHDAVALLDGGWKLWQQEGRPARSGVERQPAKVFVPQPRPEFAVDASTVQRLAKDARYRVVDSRTADRYRGENETIDPVAGHVPGAISGPYPDNLAPDGRFRPVEELRARFQALLGGGDAEHTVFYCGSGVSAAHNVLAVAHAGLGEAKLYPGSWSEWIAEPARPIATGPEPGA